MVINAVAMNEVKFFSSSDVATGEGKRQEWDEGSECSPLDAPCEGYWAEEVKAKRVQIAGSVVRDQEGQGQQELGLEVGFANGWENDGC